MNNLDERVMEKLLTIVRGKSEKFSIDEARHLSSWLCMKFMVRDQHPNTTSRFYNDALANFYLTGLPPKDIWIGIAKIKSIAWAVAFHRQQADPSRSNAIASTMGLGDLIAFVQYPTDARPWEAPRDLVYSLWPNPAGFDWPISRQLTEPEIRAIAVRFNPRQEAAGDVLGRSQMHLYYDALSYPSRTKPDRRQS